MIEEKNSQLRKLTEEMVKENLRQEQNYSYAIIGGLLVTLICAFIWATITVITGFQIGYMAIFVGLVVGLSIRFLGAGIDKNFGYIGAFLAILSCFLGNLFSQVGFIVQEYSLGYIETFSLLNFSLIIELLIDTFSPIDLFFYIIAMAQGYKLSFKNLNKEEIEKLKEVENYSTFISPYSNLRLPIVFASIFLIGLFLFTISRGVNGIKTYYYDSGEKFSEGEMKKSKEEGEWTYWYENGKKMFIGNYLNGDKDSTWKWFDIEGYLKQISNYKNGLEHGVWINFYKNGSMIDSGKYEYSRMQGKWKAWYENDNLMYEGLYNRNQEEGTWTYYHLNGKISETGEMKDGIKKGIWTTYYDNGSIESQIKYVSDENILIMEYWDKDGNQLITEGNGFYQSFSNDNILLTEGSIKNGERIGEWTNYYSNGSVKEIGYYKENNFYLQLLFNPDGEKTN